jgi:hypothetical protein
MAIQIGFLNTHSRKRVLKSGLRRRLLQWRRCFFSENYVEAAVATQDFMERDIHPGAQKNNIDPRWLGRVNPQLPS